MADITVTSLDVGTEFASITHPGEAAETLTVGYAVALDANGKFTLADQNNTEATSRGVGIVTSTYNGDTTAPAGKTVSVCLFGPVSGFSGMTPGAPVYISGTAGRLDQTIPASGYQRAIGYALDATTVMVVPESSAPTSA